MNYLMNSFVLLIFQLNPSVLSNVYSFLVIYKIYAIMTFFIIIAIHLFRLNTFYHLDFAILQKESQVF